jgi:hypothetical protein
MRRSGVLGSAGSSTTERVRHAVEDLVGNTDADELDRHEAKDTHGLAGSLSRVPTLDWPRGVDLVCAGCTGPGVPSRSGDRGLRARRDRARR